MKPGLYVATAGGEPWRDEYGTVWPEIPNDVEVLSEGWSE